MRLGTGFEEGKNKLFDGLFSLLNILLSLLNLWRLSCKRSEIVKVKNELESFPLKCHHFKHLEKNNNYQMDQIVFPKMPYSNESLVWPFDDHFHLFSAKCVDEAIWTRKGIGSWFPWVFKTLLSITKML